MPAKNTIKQYLQYGYYHIYNRGVEKRLIFLDKQDYLVFLSYLKEYLLPKNEQELRKKLQNSQLSGRERDKILKQLRLNNFSEEITLLAFCLMPNHFHFFVKQKNANSIDRFMSSICTRYTMYFNKKYSRVGSLYQDVYKANLITTDEQFIYLSKYIHKQALAFQGVSLESYELQPSSYYEYIGKRITPWIKPQEVLLFFSKNNRKNSYQEFVQNPELGQGLNYALKEELQDHAYQETPWKI